MSLSVRPTPNLNKGEDMIIIGGLYKNKYSGEGVVVDFFEDFEVYFTNVDTGEEASVEFPLFNSIHTYEGLYDPDTGCIREDHKEDFAKVGEVWKGRYVGEEFEICDVDEEYVYLTYKGGDSHKALKKYFKSDYIKVGSKGTKEGDLQQEEDSREFNHYYINVKDYEYIDIYRVTDSYGATSAEHHAVKKVLCGGKRGVKSRIKDLNEAIASLQRQIEMLQEDGEE